MRSLYMLHAPFRHEFRLLTPSAARRFKSRFHGPDGLGPQFRPSTKLPETPARTRFAPSPTGYLHIGSLRTALYNYLLAKATNGQFILRVEDTDQTRIVGDAEKRLFEDLNWAGLTWDEGPDIGGPYGPYRQSNRLDIYNGFALQLLEDGKAYRCFCSPEDLDQAKALALAEGALGFYPGTCSHIPPDVSARRATNGEPHCIRFRGDDPPPIFTDLVYGRYKQPFPEEDFIIIKRDGFPTYHFANVIDDHLMQITHVIRGEEWLVSTPRHVSLYNSFGWDPPTFAHVGLLVDQNRQKLSKRHGDIDIASYRAKGVLPEALLNYVILLGWSPARGTKKHIMEVMDLNQMIQEFHLKFTKGNCVVSNKLNFLNNKRIKKALESKPEEVAKVVAPLLEKSLLNLDHERVQGQSQPRPKPEAVTDGAASDGDGSTNIRTVLSRAGPLLPATVGTKEGTLDHDYLFRVFQLSPWEDFRELDPYILKHLYLFWELPTSELRETLANSDWVQGLAIRSEIVGPVSDPTEDKSEYKRKALSEFLITIEQLLNNIGVEDWTPETLKQKLLPLVESLYAWSHAQGCYVAGGGYHVLRWFLFGARPGPALLSSIAVLGRDEVMKRLIAAKLVAAEQTTVEDTAEFGKITTEQ